MRGLARPEVRSAVEGLAIGVAAAFAMVAVAALGTQLAFTGTGVDTPTRTRATAAAVAMSVGSPLDLTMSGTAVPGGDRLQVPGGNRFALPGGIPITVTGPVDARPLGVTFAGIAALVLLFRWRRRSSPVVPLAAGAFVGFVAGVGVCAAFGRAGPVDVEKVTVVFRTGVGAAVLGAAVVAALALGACLLPPLWRRPVAAVATVLGGVAALATLAGVVIGAVHGGARVAGGAVLAGANGVGALPWGLGVPWNLDLDGPLASALHDRVADVPDGGSRFTSLGAAATCVILLGILTTERGWPAAARLAAALAGGFAAVTAATTASATATATVFVFELPAAEVALRGNLFVAALVGAVAGALGGLLPFPARPRVRSHGVPSRRR